MNALVETLIRVQQLKKYFRLKNSLLNSENSWVKAVDGVSFAIHRGETFGLVGESGCGKSTLGRTITRMYDVTQGEIHFAGTDIAQLDKKALRPYRQRIQVIFQDPYSALNPYMTLAEIIDEPLAIHTQLTPAERREKIRFLLAKVGMAQTDLEKFPHEFSGGQRQRIGIARALAIAPEFILCDEPISALDVSIQAQVVNLLEDFQAELGLTYLFVAHDLAMVRHISKRIGVMYLGKIVEIAASNDLYRNPLHPYTQALLSAIPVPDPHQTRGARPIIQGDPPSPVNIPRGCRFHTRCPQATARCREAEPELKELASGHSVSCHLHG